MELIRGDCYPVQVEAAGLLRRTAMMKPDQWICRVSWFEIAPLRCTLLGKKSGRQWEI
jgi:hypothetical protein